MVVRIRLVRFGRRHQPFFNIVIANARTARNSKPLEVIGTFDPLPQPPPPEAEGEAARPFKAIKLDVLRAKYWLGVGAQPSDAAWAILEKAGLLSPPLKKQESRWRATVMDALLQGVHEHSTDVPRLVREVSKLKFLPEQDITRSGSSTTR